VAVEVLALLELTVLVLLAATAALVLLARYRLVHR
jgi:hypothetical protein